MKLVYENNKFVTADFIVKRKESEETIANNKGKTNPNTADNIVTYIVLFAISLLGLVLGREKLKNKKSTQN